MMPKPAPVAAAAPRPAPTFRPAPAPRPAAAPAPTPAPAQRPVARPAESPLGGGESGGSFPGSERVKIGERPPEQTWPGGSSR
jgi:hypothetical protein